MGSMGIIRSFGELLNKWTDDYLPNVLGKSKNTIKSYKTTWVQMITFLYLEKGIDADKITFDIFSFELIMEFLDWLKKENKIKDATRNNRRAAIVKFSEYAQNYNFDAACKFYSEAHKVPGKKVTDSCERIAMSKEQTKAFLNMPDINDRYGRRDQAILSFLYATGCRSQELCDVQVKDVKIQEDGKASIHLHGKGKKDRRIRISKKYADIVIKHIKRVNIANQHNHYLFASQRNSKMSLACLEKLVNKYYIRAIQSFSELFSGIKITPHTFRHTTATHMLEAGVPLVVVSRFLGHSDIQTTLIYAKLTEADVNEKLKDWDRKFWGEYIDEPSEGDEYDNQSDVKRNLSKIFANYYSN